MQIVKSKYELDPNKITTFREIPNGVIVKLKSKTGKYIDYIFYWKVKTPNCPGVENAEPNHIFSIDTNTWMINDFSPTFFFMNIEVEKVIGEWSAE